MTASPAVLSALEFQRIDTRLHHVAPLFAIKRRDEADTAGIMLLRRVVGALQAGDVLGPIGNEGGALVHVRAPSHSAAAAKAFCCM